MCVFPSSLDLARDRKNCGKKAHILNMDGICLFMLSIRYTDLPQKLDHPQNIPCGKKKSFMFEKTTASERLVYIGIGINLLWHLRRPDSDFDGFFSSLCVCVVFHSLSHHLAFVCNGITCLLLQNWFHLCTVFLLQPCNKMISVSTT